MRDRITRGGRLASRQAGLTAVLAAARAKLARSAMALRIPTAREVTIAGGLLTIAGALLTIAGELIVIAGSAIALRPRRVIISKPAIATTEDLIAINISLIVGATAIAMSLDRSIPHARTIVRCQSVTSTATRTSAGASQIQTASA